MFLFQQRKQNLLPRYCSPSSLFACSPKFSLPIIYQYTSAIDTKQQQQQIGDRKRKRQMEQEQHLQTKYQHSTNDKLLKGYIPVIGIEIHAQVLSNSKLFSTSSTEFNYHNSSTQNPAQIINNQVSLIDAALPGTLPILNQFCVAQAIKTGLALQATICKFSKFDRKHYFYADMPQGYQITQQFFPIVRNGKIEIDLKEGTTKIVNIERIQLEQDSGKSVHDQDPHSSLIDLNRSGIALMEIISAPCLHSSMEAEQYIKQIQFLLKHIGTCDGNMSQGSLRCDVNISVHKPGTPLGTRCEIKNIASIANVTKAIDYEIKRQIECLEEKKETIEQQTRFFDVKSGTTIVMRSKEDAPDYRFLPEPDLPPILLNEETIQQIRTQMPPLPNELKNKLMDQYGLSAYESSTLLYAQDGALLLYFEQVLQQGKEASTVSRNPKTVVHFILNDLLALLNQENLSIYECPVTVSQFASLIDALDTEIVNIRNGRQILKHMFLDGDRRNAIEIIKEKQWEQLNDSQELESLCEQAWMKHEQEIQSRIAQGQMDRISGVIIGEVMKLTQQRANAKVLQQVAQKHLQMRLKC